MHLSLTASRTVIKSENKEVKMFVVVAGGLRNALLRLPTSVFCELPGDWDMMADQI